MMSSEEKARRISEKLGYKTKDKNPLTETQAMMAERMRQDEVNSRRITNDGINYPIPYVIVFDINGHVDAIYTNVNKDSFEDIKKKTSSDQSEIVLGTKVLKKEFVWK